MSLRKPTELASVEDYPEGEKDFTGSSTGTGGVGLVVGTAGRAGTAAPANLPNGDAAFSVIAFNTASEHTQQGLSLGPTGAFDQLGVVLCPKTLSVVQRQLRRRSIR